jgi:RNA polymerase sigma factor (sigma-70 family)
MATSQANLLEQAVGGNQDALSALLKQHASSLRSAVAGQVPRRWRSVLSEEDVIQETFADAFHDIGGFDPSGRGSFGGWLATVAQRNLRDAIRMLEAEKRGGDRRRVEIAGSRDSHTALIDLLSSDGTTPSRHVAADEVHARLEQSIRMLPRDYRVVVQMYDLEGDHVDKIAAALNRSRGAVYMLRARAHDWLRESLGAATNFFTDSA